MKMLPAERVAVKGLMRLPAPLLARVAAGVETRSRAHLDPATRLLLALSSIKPAMNTLRVEQAREVYSDLIATLDVSPIRRVRAEDHWLVVDDAKILLRVYTPSRYTRPGPAIQFMHGGGFTVGSVEDYDPICRYIAHRTGAMVISVDYRLAPEFAAPTAAEDCLAAWQWVQDHHDALGIDPQRTAVMGDSAGGNLSIVVSQQAAARGLPLPAVQVLFYPSTDAAMDHPSVTGLGVGFGLDEALLAWFVGHYVREPAMIDDPRVSPLRYADVAGQPPAILITCTDPLRDEGLAYGDRLRQADCQVIAMDYPELVHGFITMGGALRSARRAVDEVCDTLQGLL